MRAIMIVPGEGRDSKQLLSSAMHVRGKLYGGSAIVYQTVLTEAPTSPPSAFVTFQPASPVPRGVSPNFGESINAAGTVLVLAHHGSLDGPILKNTGDFRINQPWHTERTGTDLWLGGRLFWEKVGQAEKTQKIILFGCDSGVIYAKTVNKAAGIPVFGFKGECAPANQGVALEIITALEGNLKVHGVVREAR